jgi:hypothetical protein
MCILVEEVLVSHRSSVDVADFSGSEGGESLPHLVFVDRILVHEQVHCGRLIEIRR